MKQSDSLASDGAENTLIIRILRGENFESVFEDELPSCYCLYTFYIYQNQEQFGTSFFDHRKHFLSVKVCPDFEQVIFRSIL